MMKCLAVFLLTLGMASAFANPLCGATPPSASQGDGIVPQCEEARTWSLVPELSDEFEASRLDAAKWDDWCATFQGRRAAGPAGSPCETGFWFRPDNVAVENGELVLTARLLDEREKASRENAYTRYAPYATSIVKSRRKICYGYFEIRAKTMSACVSNAFWLYDPHSEDLDAKYSEGEISEEIDIFEVTGRPDFYGRRDCTRTYYNTVHWYCTPYLEGIVNRKLIAPPNRSFKTKTDFGFGADYHTHGFLWTPKKLVWYLDGKPVATRENDRFHRPLHVTLDCEVFASWFGRPDPKDLPAKFRVDYLRTWACPKGED